jgi:hypothetical protein
MPDDAQFCLKCGKPVGSPVKNATVMEVLPSPSLPRPRSKRRVVLWILLAVLVGGCVWAVISDSPAAQMVQEFVGWKHDSTILDGSFTVSPHSFRYYKFALPEGSVNVAIVGQFGSAADLQNAGNGKQTAKARKKGKDKDEAIDNNIEVYVLTEPAFTVWQNGYATSSVYESGKVAEGAVQADIPAGAEIYYLVFSNKSSVNTPKNVHATVLLRYKSWLPDWFRRMKGRVTDWLGL